jgi:hypothetical protein
MVTPQWRNQLSLAIVHAVHILQARLGDDVLVILALDCHPWNGGLSLAALTQSEVNADPSLCDPAEMAAWTNYHFAESGRDWNIDALCDTMKTDYYSSEDHDGIAQSYLRSCAAALSDESVLRALQQLLLHDDFRLSVTHPDDRTEYCTQKTR